MSAGEATETKHLTVVAQATGTTIPLAPVSAPGGPVQGYVDKIDNQRVRGWAWHRGQPAATLDIEVWLDDRLLASGPADRLRPDLAKANVGDGRKGYDIGITDPLTDAELTRLVVAARLGRDGRATPLVNRVFAPAPSPASLSAPSPAPAEPSSAAVSPQTVPRPAPERSAEADSAIAQNRAVAKPAKAREGEGMARELADLGNRLERQLADMAGALDRMDGGLADQQRARETVDRQIAHLETVQARIDEILAQDAAMRQASAHQRSFERGLVIAVALACALSLASLLIGLHSIFS